MIELPSVQALRQSPCPPVPPTPRPIVGEIGKSERTFEGSARTYMRLQRKVKILPKVNGVVL